MWPLLVGNEQQQLHARCHDGQNADSEGDRKRALTTIQHMKQNVLLVAFPESILWHTMQVCI